MIFVFNLKKKMQHNNNSNWRRQKKQQLTIKQQMIYHLRPPIKNKRGEIYISSSL